MTHQTQAPHQPALSCDRRGDPSTNCKTTPTANTIAPSPKKHAKSLECVGLATPYFGKANPNRSTHYPPPKQNYCPEGASEY